MGTERSYASVARQLHKSTTLLRRWSSEDRWRERVQAWDAECDRRRRQEFHDASADIARAQAEDAAALRESLLSPARVRAKLAQMATEDRDPFEGMSAAELVRLSAATGRVFAQVVQVEGLARGAQYPERGVAALVPPEIERKSVAELEAYLTGGSVA